MKPTLFILGGPQCAGKSTVKSYLYARFMTTDAPASDIVLTRRNLVLLREMRQEVMHERGIHSGIFIDAETELEIIRRDLARLDQIIERADGRVYLDETSVLTLAHARSRNIDITGFVSEYQRRFSALCAALIFVNVTPAQSWERRKPRYEERVRGFPPAQAATVLASYRAHIDCVHQFLHEVAGACCLSFSATVDASGSSEDTLEGCAKAFSEICSKMDIPLHHRF